jgi:hypothetical protein
MSQENSQQKGKRTHDPIGAQMIEQTCFPWKTECSFDVHCCAKLWFWSSFPLLSFPLRTFDPGAVYISGEYFNLVPVKWQPNIKHEPQNRRRTWNWNHAGALAWRASEETATPADRELFVVHVSSTTGRASAPGAYRQSSGRAFATGAFRRAPAGHLPSELGGCRWGLSPVLPVSCTCSLDRWPCTVHPSTRTGSISSRALVVYLRVVDQRTGAPPLEPRLLHLDFRTTACER